MTYYIINTNNIYIVRNIIEQRINHGKKPLACKSKTDSSYTISQLKQDITNITKEKNAFVHEAEKRENRLFILIDGLNILWKDEDFTNLLEKENLMQKPQLKGVYNDF